MSLVTSHERNRFGSMIRYNAGLAKGWRIKIETKPFLGVSFFYQIDLENKVIDVKLYSGHYQAAFELYYKHACKSMKQDIQTSGIDLLLK